MRINLVSWESPYDGYGRFATHLAQALALAGVQVCRLDIQQPFAEQIQYADGLFLSVLPPFCTAPVPGRHWVFTMTEGSELPAGWADDLHAAGVERILVPCEHNKRAFASAGLPIDVVPGGTEPAEFPIITERPERPYTFLTIADRGARKGWVEVHDAFYRAFGEPKDTADVRLIIKGRASLENDFLKMVANAQNADPRFRFWLEDVDHPSEVYRQADCLALPSRSEGWGMPHREAAMMGLPVITIRHSGMDDGHTDEWAMVVQTSHETPIPGYEKTVAGTWRKADVTELATWMRWCYEHPVTAVTRGTTAAQWLRGKQTWRHSAERLKSLVEAA